MSKLTDFTDRSCEAARGYLSLSFRDSRGIRRGYYTSTEVMVVVIVNDEYNNVSLMTLHGGRLHQRCWTAHFDNRTLPRLCREFLRDLGAGE